MIKRISAFQIVFNFLLTMVELLIGVRFLLGLFGSDETAGDILMIVKKTLEEMGLFASGIMTDSGMERPIAALLLVLGFMLFSFILIIIVPTIVERKERELELFDD